MDQLQLFGVEWDPAYYFQMLVSLHWQQVHARNQWVTAACQNALQVYTAALQEEAQGEIQLRLPGLVLPPEGEEPW